MPGSRRRFRGARMVCLSAVAAWPAVLTAAGLPAAAQESGPAAAAPSAAAPTPDQERLRIVGAKAYSGAVHVLPANTDTTQWGWFDNAQPPVLHVNSGDTVVFETMMHSHNQIVPGTTIETIKKLRTDYPGRGPHSLTGPVYVDGAQPGDVLKVHINRIVPRAYGTNFNVPGMFGEFPDRFPQGQVKYFYLDLERKVAEFAPGIEIPLAPFPGTIGVARAEAGQYSSVPPGAYGGNMDIRDLVEGTTLYLPVFVDGALLWTGDSHAAQGNGEINLTALETAFKEMSVTLEVVKATKLEWPRIETGDAWISVGIAPTLDAALEVVEVETAKVLIGERRMAAIDTAAAVIAEWDCRVSQVVDVNKGLHCFTAKPGVSRTVEPLPERDDDRHVVTVGRDISLDKAMDGASWQMIEVLERDRKLSRLDAYGLASMVMDCRVAPPGGTEKAVHCLVPKSIFVTAQ